MSAVIVGLLTALGQNAKAIFGSKSRKKILKCLVMFVVVFLLLQLLSNNKLYTCPSAGYRFYGSFFLLGPSACLFVIALFLDKSFWEKVTGCYRARNCNCATCGKVLKAFQKSAFIAIVWFILAFAKGKFYVCIRLGALPSQNVLQSMDKHQREIIEKQHKEIKSQSMMIAWSLFLATLFFLFLTVLVQRCFFSVPEESLPSLRQYEKLEAQAAVAKFKEQIKELAQKEGEKQVESKVKEFTEKNEGPYEALQKTKMWLAIKYPRTTGNWTKDYRVGDEQALVVLQSAAIK